MPYYVIYGDPDENSYTLIDMDNTQGIEEAVRSGEHYLYEFFADSFEDADADFDAFVDAMLSEDDDDDWDEGY